MHLSLHLRFLHVRFDVEIHEHTQNEDGLSEPDPVPQLREPAVQHGQGRASEVNPQMDKLHQLHTGHVLFESSGQRRSVRGQVVVSVHDSVHQRVPQSQQIDVATYEDSYRISLTFTFSGSL